MQDQHVPQRPVLISKRFLVVFSLLWLAGIGYYFGLKLANVDAAVEKLYLWKQAQATVGSAEGIKVAYAFTVDGKTYRGAHTPTRAGELSGQDHMLWYDPSDPSRHQLTKPQPDFASLALAEMLLPLLMAGIVGLMIAIGPSEAGLGLRLLRSDPLRFMQLNPQTQSHALKLLIVVGAMASTTVTCVIIGLVLLAAWAVIDALPQWAYLGGIALAGLGPLLSVLTVMLKLRPQIAKVRRMTEGQDASSTAGADQSPIA